MKKFYYKVLMAPGPQELDLALSGDEIGGLLEDFEKELNMLGNNGWELINTIGPFLLFKTEQVIK